jgi:hypothetical protein
MKRGIIFLLLAALGLLIVYSTVEAASWLNFHVSGGAASEYPRPVKIFLMTVMIAMAMGRGFYLRRKMLRLQRDELGSSKG